MCGTNTGNLWDGHEVASGFILSCSLVVLHETRDIRDTASCRHLQCITTGEQSEST